MTSASRIRPRYRWLVALVLVVVPVVIAGPWMYVRLATLADVVPLATPPGHADIALVLGAKVGDDGEPSVFLRERVDAAVELYREGVVDTLVMSGARRGPDYDEPATMVRLALEQGVPEQDIVIDAGGWDTFASCANARDLWGAERVIIVTQQFHAPRATWLCQQAGIDAASVYPRVVGRAGTVTGNIRELGATWKAVINVWTGREG